MSALPGLDRFGQAIIAKRLSLILAWLRTHLDPSLTQADLENRERRQPLVAQFTALESRTRQDHASDWSARQNGLAAWRDDVLLPLASALDFVSITLSQTITDCWHQGLFDIRQGHKREALRPDLKKTVGRVQEVLAQTPYKGQRIQALRSANICQDEAKARRVAEALDPISISERAAWQARGLILAVLGQGVIGLLTKSDHDCVDELLRLQRLLPHILALTDHPDEAMSQLRADLVALKRTLKHVSFGLWQEHLLHELPGSDERVRFRARLTQDVVVALLKRLVQDRGCPEDEARELFERFASHGLAGLVDWRCSVPGETIRTSLRWQRVTYLLDRHVSGISVEGRQEIEVLLTHLLAAIDEAEIAFPILRLLDEYPSSPYRVRFGRRVWFGLPAIASRRQPPRTYRGRRKASLRKKNPLPPEKVQVMLERFAARASLPLSNAQYRLRGLITSGAIGLLNLTERKNLISSQLRGYLHFMKLGLLEGTLDWSRLLEVLHWQAALLRQPPLSRQVAMALFNLLIKPRRWHGGTGRAVARVRQRATLHVGDLPRLHQAWAIVPFELWFAGRPYFMLLVVDCGSQLPMGLWGAEQPPGVVEMGLALYQAIWHIGALDWPLHGLPEMIIFPPSARSLDLRDVRQAAGLMLADTWFWDDRELGDIPGIKIGERGLALPDDLIQRIKAQFPDHMRSLFPAKAPTSEELQHALLQWLYVQCFPTHRAAEVPAEYREQGYAMPAWDSVTAALLLPPMDGFTAARNAVRFGEAVYGEPGFALSPGVAIEVRQYPQRHLAMQDGIFVRLLQDEPGHFTYLQRSRPPVRLPEAISRSARTTRKTRRRS